MKISDLNHQVARCGQIIIKNNISKYGSITAIICYLIFTFISYLHYPKTFSPFMNWLSDLGNPLENFSGSFFYNFGCIVVGCFLILFLIGMYQWHSTNRKTKGLIMIAQIAGISSALALIVTAVFPLGSFTDIHSLWSKLIFIGFAFFESFLAVAIFKSPGLKKWIGYYGILASILTFIFNAVFIVFIGEWITISMFIIYILIITYQYNRFMNNAW